MEESYYSHMSRGLLPKEQKDIKREPEEEMIYCALISTSSRKEKGGYCILSVD